MAEIKVTKEEHDEILKSEGQLSEVGRDFLEKFKNNFIK